jgi:hypothetical protein
VGSKAECFALRNIKLDAHHIAVHQREHEGAARRISLRQAAHIDVALSATPSNGATTC